MRVKPGKLHIACISDIHLGHNKNPTSRIVDNLLQAFPDNAETGSLDIIFINGDLFDQLLMFNDQDIFHIDRFICHLAKISKKYNILVELLEGTRGHDREQPAYIQSLNEMFELGMHLRYIPNLSIEYIAEHDIHVLYVPDDLPGGADQTLRDVKELMRAKGLEQVDLAMMHGVFEFQLPPNVAAQKHNSAEYLKLVKGIISIGHDHNAKQLDRIHVQGSFDCLAHGYETPKGHIRALQHEDDTWDVSFVVNENSMKFITIDCVGKSLEETFEYISKRIQGLPDDSHIRVRAQHDHPIFTNMDVVIRTAPTMSWTKDPQREKKDAIAPLSDIESKYIPISITQENLPNLVLDRLVGFGASGSVMDAATDILAELFPFKGNSRASENGRRDASL